VSKRDIKTDGLSLADVLELKKAAIEQERLDAMFEAERDYDFTPDFKWPEIRPLTEAEKEAARNKRERLRMAATFFWPQVIGSFGGTVEEKAVQLAAQKEQIPPNVWRKLLLDLVVDITPLDKPVPATLIALLRDALGLPENHKVGGWPLTAGMSDDRGKPDHEARECASLIDHALLTHSDVITRRNAKPMPLNMLRRKVEAKLGRAPAPKTLREWRQNLDYWHLTPDHRQAQFGGRRK
jgi:hypothetical protein